MSDRFTTRLKPGQAMTLAVTGGPRRVVVTSGRLWLTLSGDPADHWLAAGEGLTVAAGQQAVVESGPEAEFQLLQPVPKPRRTHARPARSWLASLAGQGA